MPAAEFSIEDRISFLLQGIAQCRLEASRLLERLPQHLLDQAAKPKTINRWLAALAAFARWLEQAGYVRNARNRVQGVKVVGETALDPKWLDKKQRAALLRAVVSGTRK